MPAKFNWQTLCLQGDRGTVGDRRSRPANARLSSGTEGPRVRWRSWYSKTRQGRAILIVFFLPFFCLQSFACLHYFFHWSLSIVLGQAEFGEQLVRIKERSRARLEEIEGGWYSEERMDKDLGYSKCLTLILGFVLSEFAFLTLVGSKHDASIPQDSDSEDQKLLHSLEGCVVQACLQFLMMNVAKKNIQSSISMSWHTRSNRYDASIVEYFVQTSDKVKITRADLDKWQSARVAANDEARNNRINKI